MPALIDDLLNILLGGILLAYRTILLILAPVSYTHLRAHETVLDLVCRLLLEKKKHTSQTTVSS